MITYKSKIKKIVFDIRFEGEKKYHKDVEVKYDFDLYMDEIHQEDNNSWNAIDIDDYHYDIQIFGEDDTLALDEYNEWNARKAMTIPLYFQLGEVEKNENGEWEHNGVWLCSQDVSIKNVRIYTNDGIKRVKLN